MDALPVLTHWMLQLRKVKTNNLRCKLKPTMPYLARNGVYQHSVHSV